MERNQRGFTLIELSIVLVITGLLVSSIVIASSMIGSAQMRKAVREVEALNAAVNAFKNKYACLPGDCANATDFFPADADDCAKGTVAQGTCNGDGSGTIGCFGEDLTPGCFPWSLSASYDGRERFLAIQQLALAFLIPGTYSGTSDSHDSNDWNRAAVVGWNVPASTIPAAGYMIMHLINPNGDDRWPSTGNWIFLGNPKTDPYVDAWGMGEWYETSGAALSPHEARSVDQKIDDGRPDTGNVLTIYNSVTTSGCTTGEKTDPTPPAYLNSKQITCSLQFKASF